MSGFFYLKIKIILLSALPENNWNIKISNFSISTIRWSVMWYDKEDEITSA